MVLLQPDNQTNVLPCSPRAVVGLTEIVDTDFADMNVVDTDSADMKLVDTVSVGTCMKADERVVVDG